MSKPPPSAPTASAIGPCPTVIKIVGRPGTGSLPSTVAPPVHPRHLRNIPVKSFQNLSTDLAEEVVKSLFLFIALVAILFNIAESFEQFWYRVTQETFMYNYFKIHLLVQERKLFKGFSIFSSGGHLVQRSETV